MSKVFDSKFKSLLDEVESDPVASREMAAARLSFETLSILNLALSNSGLSQRDLAEKLGVSESAVSQTLFGDGNLRIYTFARYLKALGFEANLGLTSGGVLVSNKVARPRVKKSFQGMALSGYETSSEAAFVISEGFDVTDGAMGGNLGSGGSQPNAAIESEKLPSVVEVPGKIQTTTAIDFSLAA